MIKSLLKLLHPRYQTLFLEYPVDFKPRNEAPDNPNPHQLDVVKQYDKEYVNLIDEVLVHKEFYQSIPYESKNDEDLVWNNSFFPGLDIAVLYTLVHKYQPKKIIEVGSGTSTVVMRKAIKNGSLHTKITSVDPHPRRDIDSLADTNIRKKLEDVDPKLISDLEAGDILFIDNSHRSLPNSDVTVFFLEILPLVKPGVLIHVHDIYIPFDYPQFMCDRFYNEQYLLATLLISNPDRYEIVSPNFYIHNQLKDYPKFKSIWDFDTKGTVEQHGGSFWFIKKY